MDNSKNETAESSDDGPRDGSTLKQKYDLLERNYRRLLEVTTTLTEALEHAVKGNPYELEKKLNHCMEIYPELFSLQIRKPPRSANFRTAYNTSVSDNVTDSGEIAKTYEYYSKPIKPQNHLRSNSRTEDRSSSERDSNRSKYSERQIRSSNITDTESQRKRQRSPGLSFVKLNDDNTIPPIFNESSFEVLQSNNEASHSVGGYPLNNDVNIMSLYPSTQSHKHGNFNSDNESSVVVTPVTERELNLHSPNTDASYTVKHPESDTDGSTRLKRSRVQTKNQAYHKEEKCDPEKLVLEQTEMNNPFEIVVQGNKQQRDIGNDAEFSIQIIPDSASSRRNTVARIDKDKHTPNETRIIIKKHVTTNKTNNNNEIIFNTSTDQISLNVTIAKIHSLSTGLQEHSDMLQPIQYVNRERGNTSQRYTPRSPSPRNERQDLEQPTKIALLNSYGTNNKPNTCDEAFDEIKNDYLSIKYNLLNGSVKQKSLILQSLRLNLIHTLANERAVLLSSYIENDILNLYSDPSLLEVLMPKEIINGWDLLLQQTIFKFLNTVSSMWKGRDYLASEDVVTTSMLKYFNDKFTMKVPSEAICKDMLIATFHKLSTRVNPQTILINAGIAEKVVFSLLENRDSITPYRLRHTLGLFINISVSKHGRKLMEPLANEVLVLLATLLSSKEKKIVSSATRLLYLLMANEKYHKEANKMEIIQVVDEAMKVANKRIKLQLETLKSVMEHSKPHTHLHNADAEEIYLKNIEPEIDELEEEVEIGEPGIINTQTELYKKYEAENSHKISSVFSHEEQIKSLLNVDKDTFGGRSEGYKKSRGKGKNDEDDLSNYDGITIETGNVSASGGKSTNNNNNDSKHSADSRDTSKDQGSKKGKGRKGKKRDSDTFSMLSSNYTLLKEALDNIIDDQTNYNIIPEIVDEEGGKPEITQKITITQEKLSISSKTAEPQKGENVETIPAPIKITQTESVSKSISRPPSQMSEMVTQRSRKHSLFSQDGKNMYDYEYCEETKQIQLPLQHDNIFSEARESPLKGLLELSKENKMSKPNTPLITALKTISDDKVFKLDNSQVSPTDTSADKAVN